MSDALLGKPRIELLATDVDGVLTDGGLYWGVEGQMLKRFDVKDGYGLGMLRDTGVKIVFITTDTAEIGRARGERLRITEACTGVRDKRECLRGFMERWGLGPDQVVYMGDDLIDLPAREVAGTFVAPADAVATVREQAHWVTRAGGGRGAMREVCDAILVHNERVKLAADQQT